MPLELRESLSSRSDSPESSELASDGDPCDLLDRDLEANDFLDFKLGDGEAALDLLLDFTLLAGLCGLDTEPGYCGGSNCDGGYPMG